MRVGDGTLACSISKLASRSVGSSASILATCDTRELDRAGLRRAEGGAKRRSAERECGGNGDDGAFRGRCRHGDCSLFQSPRGSCSILFMKRAKPGKLPIFLLAGAPNIAKLHQGSANHANQRR